MKMENKSILVSGGAGFIGSHLVDRLILENPKKIVVVDNFFLGKTQNLDEAKRNFGDLKIYNENAANEKRMEEIIKSNDIDVIVNPAVIPLPVSFKRPKWTYEQNIAIVMTACELLRKGLFDTLIHFSSAEVYGTAKYVPMDEDHPLHPTTPYAASKVSCDMLATSYQKVFGLDVSIVRPFNNFGPRQNEKSYSAVIPTTIKRILNGKAPVLYGDGKQTRDYIYVTDTVDAIVRIYKSKKRKGKIINIANGKEVEIGRLIGMIADIMNCNKKIKHEKPRPSDVRRHLADTTLVKKLINFKPKVGLEEGLKNTVEWYCEKLG
jgi:UDP-glucose 4-epimerase